MPAVAVGVRGLVRGRELAGDAEAVLEDAQLRLVRPGTGHALLALPVTALEGVRHEAGLLTLFLDGEDAVELSAADDRALRTMARELVATACALPELTRALRAMGTHRTIGLSEHDRFFTPLLHARRAAEGAREPLAQIAAFDVAVLRARLEELVRRAATEHYPEHPPARRSLEAELQECVEPLARRLARLGELGALAREESDEMRLAAWRRWAAALADVFVTADACWVSVATLLRVEPYEQPEPWWRRMMRRGARTP